MSAPQPVILIGAARSGTKFLRDTLASAGGVARVPYDINYVWRTGNERLDHDEIAPGDVSEGQRETIRKTIAALARDGGDTPDFLVEKTVSNTLRVPLINAVYPDARFIHIVRDGREVIESSIRMWQAPPDKGGLMNKLKDLPLSQYHYVFWFALNFAKGLMKGRSGGEVWGPRYKGIMADIETRELEAVVARQWTRSVMKASDDLAELPTERVITVRYDDLVRDDTCIGSLCDWLGVSDKATVISTFNQTVQRGNDAKWRKVFDADMLALIEREAGGALRRTGYIDA